MSEVSTLLSSALAQRPQMQAQDAVKLLYQRCFGPAHLLETPEQAIPALLVEWEGCQGESLALTESLGNGLCRVNLAPAKALGLAPETICRLLKRCADSAVPDRRGFYAGLELIKDFSFTESDAIAYVNGYLISGRAAVHHSARYREAYHPAYRLALERDAAYLPLLAHLDRELPRRTARQPLFLAIDGRSASGKTTLAALLSQVYGALVLHMDDYFLPPHRKTPERLAQPGGNVDWERFQSEALRPLLENRPALLRPYDCQNDRLLPPQVLVPCPLIVVEGAYSLHPALASAYDCKVFLSLPPEEQAARILSRNGPAMAERFQREWIPLEETYFAAYGTESQCDFLFRS